MARRNNLRFTGKIFYYAVLLNSYAAVTIRSSVTSKRIWSYHLLHLYLKSENLSQKPVSLISWILESKYLKELYDKIEFTTAETVKYYKCYKKCSKMSPHTKIQHDAVGGKAVLFEIPTTF